MTPEYFKSAVAELKVQNIQFEDGLTDAEIEAVQTRFGFIFPPDLRMFLQIALPVSMPSRGAPPFVEDVPPFPHWRSDDEAKLKYRLDWPYKGICFDIENNGFWMEEWGPLPDTLSEAFAIARQAVDQAPTLIPIYQHRFIPATPQATGNPIFSVWQTDIIYFGADLPGFLTRQFKIGQPLKNPDQPRRIELWSDIVEGRIYEPGRARSFGDPGAGYAQQATDFGAK